MTQLEIISNNLERMAHHLSILNDEVGELGTRIAVLESQMGDVLWLQKLLLGTVIVAIGGTGLGLILKKRNNR